MKCFRVTVQIVNFDEEKQKENVLKEDTFLFEDGIVVGTMPGQREKGFPLLLSLGAAPERVSFYTDAAKAQMFARPVEHDSKPQQESKLPERKIVPIIPVNGVTSAVLKNLKNNN